MLLAFNFLLTPFNFYTPEFGLGMREDILKKVIL
jgi:hypothetical protein